MSLTRLNSINSIFLNLNKTQTCPNCTHCLGMLTQSQSHKTQPCGIQQHLNFTLHTSCCGHRSLWLICTEPGLHRVGHSRVPSVPEACRRLSLFICVAQVFWYTRTRATSTAERRARTAQSCRFPHQLAINQWLIKPAQNNNPSKTAEIKVGRSVYKWN